MTFTWEVILSIAAILGALGYIIKSIIKFFSVVKEIIEKNENIDKVPEIIEKVETIIEQEKEKTEIFCKLGKTLEKINEDLEVIQKEKIPKLDADSEHIKSLTIKLEKHFENDEKQITLLLAQSRQLLLTEIEKNLNSKSITVNRSIVLGELFKAYENADGNGVVSNYFKKLESLPVSPED